MVRTHAPPELGRLDDRAGFLQQPYEVRIGTPVAERLVHTAAREGPREDLGSNGVQAGVPAIEERRVRREREQRWEQLAHPVGDRHGAVSPMNADMDVKAPGVVALRDPAEIALEPAVVLRVDDVLV